MTEANERLIAWTGERCVPWADDTQVIYEHYHRYALAATFTAGKRVLDLASGEGFGAAILAANAAEVVGVDIDEPSVRHAAHTYRDQTNLSFSIGSITDPELLDGAEPFDVITCFEAIEHVLEQDALMRLVRARLAPGGLFLVSTPDVEIYTHEHGNENEFHLKELTEPEFRGLLEGSFANVAMLRQNIAVGSVVLGDGTGHAVASSLREESHGRWTVRSGVPHTYLLAAASDGPLDAVPNAGVLLDDHLTLAREVERKALDRLQPQIDAVTAERDEARTAFERTKQELAETEDRLAAERAHAAQVRAERDETAEELGGQRYRARLAEAKLDWLADRVDAAEAEIAAKTEELTRLQEEHSAAIGKLVTRYRGAVERYAPRGTTRRDVIERAFGRPAGVLPNAPELGPVAVGTSETPLVTVVIPVHGKWSFTRACLASIAASRPKVPFEVLIVDDASPDDTVSRIAGCAGVRLVRTDRNLGFVGACNTGAGQARGELLVFLNNDTEVTAGWLDALVETAYSAEDIGLVGAKLVSPDGVLSECGGIVFSDGNGWNYGRGAPADDPRYAVLREVDYCSGAALLVRADVFASVGGFDSRYAPAYYEDTDLAFAVRAAGYRTLVQPRSVITHHEGVSNGTDTASGVKRHQELNREVFREKWAATLADHFDGPGLGRLWVASKHTARGHQGGLVLVVDHQVPMPDMDSGSIRMSRLLDVLIALGQRVVFFVNNGAMPDPYTEDLRQAGVTVLGSEEAQREFLREAGEQLRLVVLSRPNVAWRYLEQVRDLAPQATVGYDTVDLHYVRLRRQADLADALGERDRAEALRKRAAASRELELGLVRSSDVSITVSEAERDLLRREVPGAEVTVVSNVHIERAPQTTPAGRSRVLFVGSFDHHPNVDAARWLAEEIMPLVRKRCPDAVLDLVGSNPTPEVLGLSRDGVVSHGWVPDLAAMYASTRVTVAPLRFGAGVKGKVGESLGLGVPVVGTQVAFEGIGVRHERDVLVGETAEEIADAVARALTDDDLWQRLADGGRSAVAGQFGSEVASAALSGLLEFAERRAAR